MSMNFGREQALLRQRLTAAGTEERAAELQARFGEGLKFLGATDDELLAAARDLTEQFPQMGRAQMTAFVRTLWQSKTHELRAVGVEILAERSALLEAPDMPFLEGLIEDDGVEEVADRIAAAVLGPLVAGNKKLWRSLKKLANGKHARLRRAAVLACQAPVCADASLFERFAELVTPLLDVQDEALQEAIDATLRGMAEDADDQVQAFASEHERSL